MSSLSSPAVHRVSFTTGLRCMLAGVAELVRTPALWPWATIPVVLLVALWLGGAVGLGLWLGPLLHGLLSPSSGVGKFGAAVLLWTARAAAAVLALWLAFVATPTLAAPALEHLVHAHERALNAPPRRPLGVFREMWCGLRAQALAAAAAAPLLAALWLVEFAIPPSGVFVLPFKLTLMSFAAAWCLLDYPLTLRGVGVRARLRMLKRHPAAALGFGTAAAAAFWIPCGAIILLPAAVLGATQLVWTIHRADPALWPELEGCAAFFPSESGRAVR